MRVRPSEWGVFILSDFAWTLFERADNPDPPLCRADWFDRCLRSKLKECGSKFRTSVRVEGIQTPVLITYGPNRVDNPEGHSEWCGPYRPTLNNGHHRWAIALEMDLDVPVLINGAWADSYGPDLPDSYT